MHSFINIFPFAQNLSRWINVLNDPDPSIRDLASQALELSCIKCGKVVISKIEQNPVIRAAQKKEIISRLESVTPQVEQEELLDENLTTVTPTKSIRKRKSIVSNLSIQQEDVTPVIEIHSNSDVQNHLRSIFISLENKKDWKERLNGMQKLHGIVLGGAHNYEFFRANLSQLKMPLEEQLQDLRSSIVRETCDCISVLSQNLHQEFSILAQYFLEGLQKLIVNTVQIMADSANLCIREILINCNMPKYIQKIVELMKGTKHKVQKIRNAEYLLLVLQTYSGASLSRYIDLLKEGISISIVDGTHEVRKAGRRSFWEFNTLFPEDAQRLFITFDLSVQKIIQNEEQDDYQLFQSTSSGRVLSANNSPKNFQPSPSSGASLRHRNLNNAKLERGNSETSITSYTSLPVEQENNNPSVEINKARAAKRVSTAPSNAKRSQIGTSSRISQGSNSSFNTQEQPSSPQVRKRPTIPNSQRKVLLPSSQQRPRDLSVEKTAILENVATILKSAKSQDWNERVYMFNKLEKMAQEGRIVELQTYFSKIMGVLELGLNDIHFKVVSNALTALQVIIPHVIESFKIYLERTLIIIFSKLTDSKIVVRNTASSILETMGNSYSGDELFPILLKVCDTQNTKILLGCLEFMHHILPRANLYFNQASHMKQCILKLNTLISSIKNKNSNPCFKVIVSIFILLYKLNRVLFLEQVLQLPKAWEYSVREILGNSIPNFELDLSEVARLSRRHDSMNMSINEEPNLSSSEYESRQNNSNSFSHDRMEEMDPMETNGMNYEKYFASKSYTQNKISNFNNSNDVSMHDNIISEDRLESKMDEKMLDVSEINQDWNERMSDEELDGSYDVHIPEEYASPNNYQTSSLEESFSDIIRKLSNCKLDADIFLYFDKIRKLSKEQDETAWTTYFPQILFLLLEYLHSQTTRIREESLHLILQLIEHQASQFDQFAELVLKRILEKLGDIREVRMVAEKAAATYAVHMNPQLILRIIQPLISSENDTILLGAIRMLSRIVSRIQKEELLEHIPRVLPALFEAFGHQNVDIRKSVVYCLVDIYIQLGDQFKPFLSNLNPSQLKLVTVYLKKRGTLSMNQ